MSTSVDSLTTSVDSLTTSMVVSVTTIYDRQPVSARAALKLGEPVPQRVEVVVQDTMAAVALDAQQAAREQPGHAPLHGLLRQARHGREPVLAGPDLRVRVPAEGVERLHQGKLTGGQPHRLPVRPQRGRDGGVRVAQFGGQRASG